MPPGYKPEVNAENLKKVGIGGHREVGDELVKIFRDKLDQNDLADKLEKFVHREFKDYPDEESDLDTDKGIIIIVSMFRNNDTT